MQGRYNSPRSVPFYARDSFSDDETERAYLTGFRAGDVNAFQDSAYTVTARVSTTHQSMLEMFKTCFSPYGCCLLVPRKVFLTGYDWQALIHLDNSFRFLIPKPLVPPSDLELLYSFIAGFGDSDGCWSASEKDGRTTFSFDITSSSQTLLVKLSSRLEEVGYHSHVYLSRAMGTVKLVEGRWGTKRIILTKNTWTLVMKRKEDVKRLAREVMPYSKHKEKISKMGLFLDAKNDDWAQMGPKIDALRTRIRAETAESVSRAEIEYKARHREPVSGVVG